MRTLNSVTLLGRCSTKPILNPEGNCLHFGLTTSIRPDREVDVKTDVHNVVVFDKSTIDDLAANLSEGQPVFVQGRLCSYLITVEDRLLSACEIIAREAILFPRTGAGTLLDSALAQEG